MNDLALHILDLIQNAVYAKASLITLVITESLPDDRLVITIADNGYGMTPEQTAQAADPYTTSRLTRKVGLGLPLCKQSAEQSGGSLSIVSAPGAGNRNGDLRPATHRPPALRRHGQRPYALRCGQPAH